MPYGIVFCDKKKGVVHMNKFWKDTQKRFDSKLKREQSQIIELEPLADYDKEDEDKDYRSKAYEMLKKFKSTKQNNCSLHDLVVELRRENPKYSEDYIDINELPFTDSFSLDSPIRNGLTPDDWGCVNNHVKEITVK